MQVCTQHCRWYQETYQSHKVRRKQELDLEPDPFEEHANLSKMAPANERKFNVIKTYTNGTEEHTRIGKHNMKTSVCFNYLSFHARMC